MHENDISKLILNASIEVHRTLGGPGLLESVYEEALAWELKQVGMLVKRQELVPIIYKEMEVDSLAFSSASHHLPRLCVNLPTSKK